MISAVFAAAVWVETGRLAGRDPGAGGRTRRPRVRTPPTTGWRSSSRAPSPPCAVPPRRSARPTGCAADRDRRAVRATRRSSPSGSAGIAEPGEILVSSVVEAIAGAPSQPARTLQARRRPRGRLPRAVAAEAEPDAAPRTITVVIADDERAAAGRLSRDRRRRARPARGRRGGATATPPSTWCAGAGPTSC